MADLVSRKPRSESHDESPAVALKTIALEYRPSPEEEHPDSEPAVPDRSTEADSEAQVDGNPLEPDAGSTETETAAPVAAEAPADLAPLQAEEKSPAPTTTEAAETLVKRPPARRKNINPAVEPVVSVAQTDEVAPAGPKSLLDEMGDLDAEVAALRRQLAKKLIEQNAQLRKMLARFDAR